MFLLDKRREVSVATKTSMTKMISYFLSCQQSDLKINEDDLTVSEKYRFFSECMFQK